MSDGERPLKQVTANAPAITTNYNRFVGSRQRFYTYRAVILCRFIRVLVALMPAAPSGFEVFARNLTIIYTINRYSTRKIAYKRRKIQKADKIAAYTFHSRRFTPTPIGFTSTKSLNKFSAVIVKP